MANRRSSRLLAQAASLAAVAASVAVKGCPREVCLRICWRRAHAPTSSQELSISTMLHFLTN
ncbi:hypothetical protein [Cohnella sp.]|uniref:hypothetical protein n=1 Tax=Cohnella sp. TaxID=1883426 RepID=UPI0035645C1E